MKKDNKGFSLVELIIVIAIMAILVGIVGSQVLPYLTKSREAKDQQIVSSWVTAALSAYSANAAECIDATYTIKIDVSSTDGQTSLNSVTGTNGQAALEGSFKELAAFTSATSGPKFASKTYQNGGSITLTIKPQENPVVYISSWSLAPNTVSTKELIAK